MADGLPIVSSKALAMEIIEYIRLATKDDDEREQTANRGRYEAASEVLLSYLWASEKGGLTPIVLTDVQENLALNDIIRSIKNKLVERDEGEGVVVPIQPATGAGGGRTAADLRLEQAWAISSQNLHANSRSRAGRYLRQWVPIRRGCSPRYVPSRGKQRRQCRNLWKMSLHMLPIKRSYYSRRRPATGKGHSQTDAVISS